MRASASAPAPPGARAAACLVELGQYLETPQGLTPHLLEHLPDRTQGLAPGAVDPLPAFDAHVHQAGLGQRAQVQRHRAERDVGHRLVDGTGLQLVFPHQAQDLAPAGRGDGRQHLGVEVMTII